MAILSRTRWDRRPVQTPPREEVSLWMRDSEEEERKKGRLQLLFDPLGLQKGLAVTKMLGIGFERLGEAFERYRQQVAEPYVATPITEELYGKPWETQYPAVSARVTAPEFKTEMPIFPTKEAERKWRTEQYRERELPWGVKGLAEEVAFAPLWITPAGKAPKATQVITKAIQEGTTRPGLIRMLTKTTLAGKKFTLTQARKEITKAEEWIAKQTTKQAKKVVKEAKKVETKAVTRIAELDTEISRITHALSYTGPERRTPKRIAEMHQTRDILITEKARLTRGVTEPMVPRARPGEDIGVQPEMFGKRPRVERVIGKAKEKQIAMEDQIKLVAARAEVAPKAMPAARPGTSRAVVEAAEAVPTDKKLYNAISESMGPTERGAFREALEGRIDEIDRALGDHERAVAGVKEFLASDAVATYRGQVGKRRLSLMSLLKEGTWPETLSKREAELLLMGRVLKPGSINKRGRVPWERVIDELADHFGMTEQQLIDRIEAIARYKLDLDDAQKLMAIADESMNGIKRMLKVLDDVEAGRAFKPTPLAAVEKAIIAPERLKPSAPLRPEVVPKKPKPAPEVPVEPFDKVEYEMRLATADVLESTGLEQQQKLMREASDDWSKTAKKVSTKIQAPAVGQVSLPEKEKIIRGVDNLLLPPTETGVDTADILYRQTQNWDDFIQMKRAIKAKTPLADIAINPRTKKPYKTKAGNYVRNDFTKPTDLRGARYDYVEQDILSGMLSPTDDLFAAIDAGHFGGKAQSHILWATHSKALAAKTFSAKVKYQFNDALERHTITGKDKNLVTSLLENISREEAELGLKKIIYKPEIKKLLAGQSTERQREVLAFAVDVRRMLDDLVTQVNDVRGLRGQKLIDYRRNYVPQILDVHIWSRLFGLDKSAEVILGKVGGAQIPDFIKPGTAFNRHALARKGGLEPMERQRDIAKLFSGYADAISKDIFYSDILDLVKVHARAFRDAGFKNNASLLESWVLEAYAGMPSRLSRAVAERFPKVPLKAAFWIRQRLNVAAFALNPKWNAFVQTSSMALTHLTFGTKNTLKGAMAWVRNPKLRADIQEKCYSHIIKAQQRGSVVYQDVAAMGELRTKIERGAWETAEEYGFWLTQKVEQTLTGMSCAAAYQDGLARGLSGRALWEYAGRGGARTQSMYNIADLPGVLRSKEVGIIAPFQTFALEVLARVRELRLPGIRQALERIQLGPTGAYETIYAPVRGIDKATLGKRMVRLGEFIAVITAINVVVDKAVNRKPWELSSFTPFFNTMMSGLDAGNEWNLPVPLHFVADLKDGIEAYLKYGNWRKLRKFALTWLLPGRLANQIWDSIEGFTAGKVVDVRGKEMFELEDTPEEWVRGIVGGIYTTGAGREYLDELQKDYGPIYEYTRIKLPVIYDVKAELTDYQEQLGQPDDDGNPYMITDYASDVRALESRTGKKFAKNKTKLASFYIESKDLWQAYYDTKPSQRIAFREKNPRIEAALYFWGQLSTLRNPASRAYVDRWIIQYDVPRNTIPGEAKEQAVAPRKLTPTIPYRPKSRTSPRPSFERPGRELLPILK